jgi:hypothetical protein
VVTPRSYGCAVVARVETPRSGIERLHEQAREHAGPVGVAIVVSVVALAALWVAPVVGLVLAAAVVVAGLALVFTGRTTSARCPTGSPPR